MDGIQSFNGHASLNEFFCSAKDRSADFVSDGTSLHCTNCVEISVVTFLSFFEGA